MIQNGRPNKNSARKNIKQNTKNMQGEISGLDQEIAMLQECLNHNKSNLLDVEPLIDRSAFI